MDPNQNPGQQPPAQSDQPAGLTPPVINPDLSGPPILNNPPAAAPQPPIAPQPAAQSLPPQPQSQPAPQALPQAQAVVSGETPPAGQFQPVIGSAPAAAQQPLPPAGGKSRFRLSKTALIATAAVIVVGGASAAAYFVTAANKPANVLRTALINTVQAKQQSFDGVVSAEPAGGDSDGLAAKIKMSGASDSEKKAVQTKMNITVSGVSLDLEARVIDDSIYVKLGDLSQVASLVQGFSPEIGNMVKSVSGTVANRWVVIDDTLLKEAGADCVLDSSWKFTDQDIDLLTDQYVKHPFTTIKSTAKDTVNGKAATKFDLQLDNKKLGQYINSLDGLSMVKSLEKCSTGEELDKDTGDLPKGNTALTVWVDKSSKRIAQVSYETTDKEAASEGVKGSIKVSFDYKPVSISKPANATPVMQVISELQSSGAVDFFNEVNKGINDKASDTSRQMNVNALQTQLETFYVENGYYPSLTDINNASWRKEHMKNLDDNALLDSPSQASKTLAASPAPGVIAYKVAAKTGGSCEADDTTCAVYTLTATLADGTQYTKKNLD